MPKVCVLSHEAQVRTGVATRIRLGYADGGRVFAPCPMFHDRVYAADGGDAACVRHICLVTHFDPAPALKLIGAEQVTAMFPAYSSR